jgi:hypothetical protein
MADLGELEKTNRGLSSSSAAVKYETKRGLIVYELYSTELSYNEGIRSLLEQYAEPLLQKADSENPILTKLQVQDLFMNLSEIVKLNATFLDQLQTRLFGVRPEVLGTLLPRDQMSWQSQHQLGDLLLNYIPFFKVYSVYAQRFESSLALLSQLLCENKPFYEFLNVSWGFILIFHHSFH